MTIKKLIAKIEEVVEAREEEYLLLTDSEDICYAEGYGDALQYVLALVEEESNEII